MVYFAKVKLTAPLMNFDQLMILRCIELAQMGQGYVSPNPMVGSVITNSNNVIAEGYHKKYGDLHAERNALNDLDHAQINDSTVLYVNLEPCSHYGKTSPCANAIVESGIKKVVVGCNDPNPEVSGRGIKFLLIKLTGH